MYYIIGIILSSTENVELDIQKWVNSAIAPCNAVYGPLDSAVDKFWSLSSEGKRPSDIMPPRKKAMFKDLCYMHRQYHGTPAVPFDQYYKFQEGTNRSKTMNKLRNRSDQNFARQQAFASRIIAPWNNLPLKCQDASKNVFKNTLKKNPKWLEVRRIKTSDF